MARQIYRVDAWIIDANGTYNSYGQDYPKNFDSRNYDGDIDTAYRRADGDASAVWADMCTKDNRQLQTVTLSDIKGNLLYMRSMNRGFGDEEA